MGTIPLKNQLNNIDDIRVKSYVKNINSEFAVIAKTENLTLL